MSKIIKNLNILKVLKIDIYVSYYIVIFYVAWGLYLFGEISFNIFGRYRFGHSYMDETSVRIFLNIALFCTPICLIGILIRFIILKSLLNNHILIKGQFRHLNWLKQGYSCITYYFEYDGKKYYENKYISPKYFEFPRMRKFKNGDELHFIFNPKKPKRNLILEIYDIDIDDFNIKSSFGESKLLKDNFEVDDDKISTNKNDIISKIHAIIHSNEQIIDIFEAEDILPFWKEMIPLSTIFLIKYYYVTITDKKIYFHKKKSSLTGKIKSTSFYEYNAFSNFLYKCRLHEEELNFYLRNGKIIKLNSHQIGSINYDYFVIKEETIKFLKQKIHSKNIY